MRRGAGARGCERVLFRGRGSLGWSGWGREEGAEVKERRKE